MIFLKFLHVHGLPSSEQGCCALDVDSIITINPTEIKENA